MLLFEPLSSSGIRCALRLVVSFREEPNSHSEPLTHNDEGLSVPLNSVREILLQRSRAEIFTKVTLAGI